MTSQTGEKKQRPLSPHLQVYKPQMTSVLSITHRACGVALSIGTLLVTIWLVAAATGEDAYEAVSGFMRSGFGTFLIFGWSVALFYHLCNGIRHLFWDTGRLFKIENAYRAGYAVLAGTLLLTALAWGVALYSKFPEDKPAETQTLAQLDVQGAE
ncbi:MAG: succinate dehydrogenase, cytochrome b556 subunit [Micavibrio sp.]|nr:succinate dehydrogenase, cytochrome b556 subunit [Micavibrio sp.]